MKKVILILSLFSLFTAYAMEEIEEEETSEIENQCVPGPVFDLSLCQQALNVVLPKALALYESEGYQAFDNYLAALGDEKKFDLIFHKLIEGKSRYIFIKELQRLLEKDPQEAVKYFNKFTSDSKNHLMLDLLRDFKKSEQIRNLIIVLVEGLNDYDDITPIGINIVYASEDEPQDQFLIKLLEIIKQKTKEYIERSTKSIDVLPDTTAKQKHTAAGLARIISTLDNTKLESILISNLRLEDVEYLLFTFGPASMENANQISRLMASFSESLTDNGIERIKILNALYKKFLSLYPQIESLIKERGVHFRYASETNPKVKVLIELEKELRERMFDIINEYIKEGKIQEVLHILKDINILPIIALILILETPKENAEVYFENLMEVVLQLILQRNFSQSEKNNLFFILLDEYQRRSALKENFLAILERVSKRLPAEATDLLDEFKEFYWHHVPERAIKKAKIETGT